MGLTPAMIDALVANGATVEMLAAVMKAVLVDEEEKRARKRANDAERQRKCRSKASASRDVTVTPRDERDPPPDDNISNPHQSSPSPKGDSPFADEIDLVVVEWNELATRIGRPKVSGKLSPDRRKHLVARLRDNGLDGLRMAMAAIERSPFCRGETTDWAGADFDFLINPKKYTKLVEGSYDPPPKQGERQPGGHHNGAAAADFTMTRKPPPSTSSRQEVPR